MNNQYVRFLNLSVPKDEADEIKNEMSKVMDHGVLVNGPEVEKFEKELANYCGRKYSVGVASGTSALFLALKGIGIKEGDEVITTALSWIATANAINMVGAAPVFADIGDDLNICPESVRRQITGRTRAVISVDFTGKLADFGELENICKSQGIFLIEDGSQALGAHFKGKSCGSYGEISAISHNPMKTLGALGEAGSVLTNSEEVKNRLEILRYNGMIRKEELLTPATNERLDTIHAAVLSYRLKKLDTYIAKRNKNASIYYEELNDCKEIDLPMVQENEKHAYYTFTIKATNRDELMHYLEERGVETRIQHPILMCRQKPYQHCKSESKKASKAIEQILCLPIATHLANEDVRYVCESIKNFYAR